ncbi:MAG: hypothetical protein RLZZ136_199 [Pseudomonadota bacterium]
MTSSPSQVAKPVAPGRIDRARFDRARFPSILEIPIRFDDLDVNWHVNNVAIIALFQEARVHFNRALALPPLGAGLRTVVGAMTVEYGGELTYPGIISISSGIIALGRSSYTFGQLIRQSGASAVYSQITMVVTDASGPAAIPDGLRHSLSQFAVVSD